MYSRPCKNAWFVICTDFGCLVRCFIIFTDGIVSVIFGFRNMIQIRKVRLLEFEQNSRFRRFDHSKIEVEVLGISATEMKEII